MTLQELFIANLKEYRKLRGLSQMHLAEKCDSSPGYIGEIEAGKRFPSLMMIEKIAGALGVESYFLFKNEPVSPVMPAKLAPSQKKEIAMRLNSAVSKVLSEY